MQNHYIIHKTIHHSPLLTLIFLHILSTRAANYRPYTLFSFPPHFVGATIGRPLSHTLPTRAANYRPYTLFSFPSRFVGATIGRPLSHTLPRSVAYDRPTLIRRGSVIPYTSRSVAYNRPPLISHGRPLIARYPIHFPVRWHITDLPSFRRGDHWSPVIPYTSRSVAYDRPTLIRRGPVIPYTSPFGGI